MPLLMKSATNDFYGVYIAAVLFACSYITAMLYFTKKHAIKEADAGNADGKNHLQDSSPVFHSVHPA